MGGGITGCPDWQADAVDYLKDVADLALVNPRRASFDVTNANMTVEQIAWEHHHLTNADAIMFWFPCETLCPITLFELGVYAAKGYNIFVGCHPDYARKVDVIEQLKNLRPDVKVHQHLHNMLDDVHERVKAIFG
jgi:hypothetical protein